MSQPKKVMKIPIGPQNWIGSLPILLALLEAGDAKGKAIARSELRRMAEVADLAVEQKEAK